MDLSRYQSTKVAGKRKRRSESPDDDRYPRVNKRQFECRTNFVDRVATDSIDIPSLEATNLKKLLHYVEQRLPALSTITSLFDKPVATEKIILLQEVNTKKHRRFFVIGSLSAENIRAYDKWWSRSLEDNLKIEIRVVYQKDYASILEDLIKVGKAEKVGAGRPLTAIAKPPRSSGLMPSKQWLSVPLRDIDKAQIEQSITHCSPINMIPSEDWFPYYAAEPKKEKKSHKKNKKRKEQAAKNITTCQSIEDKRKRVSEEEHSEYEEAEEAIEYSEAEEDFSEGESREENKTTLPLRPAKRMRKADNNDVE